jgi:hypothetical protein
MFETIAVDLDQEIINTIIREITATLDVDKESATYLTECGEYSDIDSCARSIGMALINAKIVEIVKRGMNEE